MIIIEIKIIVTKIIRMEINLNLNESVIIKYWLIVFYFLPLVLKIELCCIVLPFRAPNCEIRLKIN